MTPILRYFDCRGRAQPMRFFLAHHGVSFIDERVPFTDDWQAWASMKAERRLSGPFARLPVLEWQGECRTQTNLIASFLQREFGPDDNHRLVEETQSCLSEDIGQLYILFNLDLFAPGTDIKGFGDNTLIALDSAFTGYEELLAAGKTPFGAPGQFSIAAFWLLEVWQFIGTLFAQGRATLTAERPALGSTLQALEAEGARLAAQQAPPDYWSARPDEPQRMPVVQQALK